MQPDNAPSTSGLVRGLGLWSSTAVVIGGMIGTGIFLVTSEMARNVGSVPGVVTAWLVGGGVVLLGTLCYAELGAALPQAGGDYVYLSRGLGPLWGFLWGWKGCLITHPGGMATVAAGFMRFAGFLLPPLTLGNNQLFRRPHRRPHSGVADLFESQRAARHRDFWSCSGKRQRSTPLETCCIVNPQRNRGISDCAGFSY